jgi:amino acid adenylation domain-containing protein
MKNRYPAIDIKISEISQTYPRHTAIKFGEKRVTYRELEQTSNQIANFLYRHVNEENQENNIVLLSLERSPELIESILGVLKAGAIFVPIDPNYPQSRVEQLFRESRARWLITTHANRERFREIIDNNRINLLLTGNKTLKDPAGTHANTYCIDTGEEDTTLQFQRQNPRYSYIYFTSGSTGVPKGVLGRHRSLTHFIDWEIDEFGITENDTVSQLTNPSFDPFLRDIFVPLAAGGTLAIPESPEILLDSFRLLQWLDREAVTLMHIVPSLFKALMMAVEDDRSFSRLKFILLAGELLRGHDIKKFFEVFGNRIQPVNLYGPTETTLAKFFYRVNPKDAQRPVVPVGKPIPGAQAILLDNKDNNMRRSLVGNIGEIYIRTPFISSGYYNNKELTGNVFIKNPFSDNPQDIIYKTGDLAKELPDGNFVILGRADHQVKIRGSRVELGDIENRLLKHNAVKEVVVTANEDSTGDKFLCAYIVPAHRQEPPLDTSELRTFAASQMPPFMVPSYLVPIDKIPLSPNGKVDRKALKDIPLIDEPGNGYVPPRDEVEKKITGIWADVLGIDQKRIGIRDNFFQLGGHSLKSINLTTKVHRELNVKIPLEVVFAKPTVMEMAEYIKNGGARDNYEAITPAEQKEYYPLSSAQRRLFFLQQVNPTSTSYNIPLVMELEGELVETSFEFAFQKLMQRHESLRTSFQFIKGEPVQIIHRNVNFQIEYFQGGSRETEKRIVNAFVKPFDLTEAPMFRVGLIRGGRDRAVLVVDIHHIVTDGVSNDLLLDDFAQIYRGMDISPMNLQYKDFAQWQWDEKTKKVQENQEAHWLRKFEDEIPVLNLPTDYPRPEPKSMEGCITSFELEPGTEKALETHARETGTTRFMLLLAIYTIFLSKLSGQEDIVVGTPVAGRRHADLESVIGMFINTLALRNFPAPGKTFRQFLGEIKENTLKDFENQDYQFEDLVEKVAPERDLSRNPLFDVMFVLQNINDQRRKVSRLSMKEYEDVRKSSILDINLIVSDTEEGMIFMMQYCTALFKHDTIRRMAAQYIHLAENAAANLDAPIDDLEILTETDKRQLLQDFNDTRSEFPHDKTLHRLLEGQALKTPHRTALVFQNHRLTYGYLNERSNRLAHHLRETGVKPGDIIGLMTTISPEMVVGMQAIMKAGAAFLPIDPDYPENRISFIIRDSQARHLLTDTAFDEEKAEVIDVLHLGNPDLYRETEAAPGKITGRSTPGDSAYAIYTSGSTGTPKGVVVQHNNIVNQLYGLQKRYAFEPSFHHILLAPFTFDPSVQQIFLPLLSRGTLHLVIRAVKEDAARLWKDILRHNIDIVNTVPSLMELLAAQAEEARKRRFKYVILAGERFSANLHTRLRRTFSIETLINIYGPTEATINTTLYECRSEETRIPIGKPLMNYGVLILSPSLRLQPVGVSGEIYIMGDGVARGYLNRPELTAERFIRITAQNRRLYRNLPRFHNSDRITDRTTDRMIKNDDIVLYKTGDLARWLPDGNIVFDGRADHQVKIRGSRVELGEIENQLQTYNGIKKAAVIAKEFKKGYIELGAYYVPSNLPGNGSGNGNDGNGNGIDTGELRNFLGRKLPAFMIPSYFMEVEHIPLNRNGKVDRKALPEMTVQRNTMKLGAAYVPPTGQMEKQIAQLWKEVLGLDKVGIHDNFFDLGGNSIDIARVNSRLIELDAGDIPVIEMFRYSTIRSLAAYIGEMKNKEESRISKKPRVTNRTEAIKRGEKDRNLRRQLRNIKK